MAATQLNAIQSTGLPTNGAETVIITTPGYVYDNPQAFVGTEHLGAGQGVTVSGVVVFTVVGSGVTSASVRIRQGALAGIQVGATFTAPVAAGVPNVIPFIGNDLSRFPAQAGGGVYVVTVSETAATGASTVTGVCNVEGA